PQLTCCVDAAAADEDVLRSLHAALPISRGASGGGPGPRRAPPPSAGVWAAAPRPGACVSAQSLRLRRAVYEGVPYPAGPGTARRAGDARAAGARPVAGSRVRPLQGLVEG